ncbi:hypothetical protein PHMEG_00030626 [Phytophthora megakarya]|uniref:Uncharacterized protein n=1 Tax=Phytophthora megakarya TaxID=4795 RepID=A0A225V1J8_9STRA|nr:hypothetical protein PHMEG_00030626 [Phytophthora megakarya]
MISLREDSSIYIKRAKNDTQAKFIKLTADNFGATLEHRWRPELAPFEVPDGNTTAQAMKWGRQYESLQQQDIEWERTTETAVIQINSNGIWMSVKINITSLCRAIELPGIYYTFATPNRS